VSKRKPANDEAPGSDPILRLACVAAILAMKDTPPEDAALRLKMLGFSAKEIGGILGVTDNYVNVVESRRKKRSNKKTRAKA
jgi:hypothetical protein